MPGQFCKTFPAMGQVSFTDAMILLSKYGVQAEDVVTVARGPQEAAKWR